MVYMYQAALWCDSCANEIKGRLTREGKAPEDPDDDTSFDSDEFPKYVGTTGGESDTPDHCDAGADCLEAEELSDGTKVGALLTEELTTDGAEYVKQAVAEGGLCAVEIWKPAFDWLDYDEGDEGDEEEEDEWDGVDRLTEPKNDNGSPGDGPAGQNLNCFL